MIASDICVLLFVVAHGYPGQQQGGDRCGLCSLGCVSGLQMFLTRGYEGRRFGGPAL